MSRVQSGKTSRGRQSGRIWCGPTETPSSQECLGPWKTDEPQNAEMGKIQQEKTAQKSLTQGLHSKGNSKRLNSNFPKVGINMVNNSFLSPF